MGVLIVEGEPAMAGAIRAGLRLEVIGADIPGDDLARRSVASGRGATLVGVGTQPDTGPEGGNRG
jgi:hypothetical protein